ncbi:MAG: prephenate dehydrogenase/arogenate dehydrogenase family protein [Chitinivibrionales bacterium]|nr:prephenate dehydrogenase/arogenate dehydrogenase family protein [Chitinivibrionales bacterium]MBD3396392.1 prephenate dehydrogenase/arogenate dehydrogenase family protein [Chitinivibrionales bacterium]
MNETTPVVPRTIVIHSVGLLGGSLGLALKASGFDGTIIGLSSPAAIQTAKNLGCIDEGYGYDALSDAVARADAVFICSPILAIIECLEKLGSLSLPEGLLVTDVGSTKRTIVGAAREFLPEHVHFVGGHPMSGSEKSGPSAADPYLFQNALYVLTPPGGAPADRDTAFAAFLKRYLGCRHAFLDPEVHDTIAATVSHVPHLLAVALVNLAKAADDRLPGTLQLAAGGFRDVTRIASAPYAMWHDILTTNKETIAPILDACAQLLTRMRADLFDDNLGEQFDRAQRAREQIPSDRKGFINPLHEVLVVAKDQPGIIASISQSLAAENINIKDIEVVKVREGEGGTIKLGFDGQATAIRAIEVLGRHGFSAWERK